MEIHRRVKPRNQEEKDFIQAIKKMVPEVSKRLGYTIDHLSFGRQTHIFCDKMGGEHTIRRFPHDKSQTEMWVNLHHHPAPGDVSVGLVSSFIWHTLEKSYDPKDCTKEMLKEADPKGKHLYRGKKGDKPPHYPETFRKRVIHWHKMRQPEVMIAVAGHCPMDKLLDLMDRDF